VRVPWYAYLPLILLTVGLTWWQGSKKKEFLVPPDEKALAQIRQQTKEELKATDSIVQERPILVKPKKLILPEEHKDQGSLSSLKPEEFGDPTVAPGLDGYRALAGKGAMLLAELATQLESRGETQRALLAWERVIDSTEAELAQQDAASLAIQRLRGQLPNWNVDPTATKTVLLHARCGPERNRELEAIFLDIIALLNKASSGLIDFQLKLQPGPKPTKGSPPQPVALWFSGPTVDSVISKTASIPLANSPAEEQKNRLLLAVYKLLRDGSRIRPDLRPLRDPQSNDPVRLLETAITRRTWELWAQTFASKKS
jgi:hypothetical protein